MSHPEIREVSTAKDRKAFLDFPWKLYAGDPNWVPPLRSERKGLVGYGRHPFYEGNPSRTFLALRDGEVVGEIAAFCNHAFNEYHTQRNGVEDRTGFFGFFESIDDQEVADALLGAASDWLRSRGRTLMRGPMNVSVNYALGTLVDGFDTPPYFMMTYNPPYYDRLIRGYGSEKAEDLYSFWGSIDMLPAVNERLDSYVEQIRGFVDVKIRPMDPKRFSDEISMFLDIYNRALTNLWSFSPMTPGEMRHMASGMKHLLVPELVQIAEVDGKPVGITFCLLDYNEVIREIDGRLFPFGFLKLLSKSRQRKIRRMRVISTNVVPEYQKFGVGLVLLNALVPKVMEWGIEEAEFSWVMDSNHQSRRSLERGGAKITKTYRIYDYRLGQETDHGKE
ncbi:MAG: GNAT family N-acetyltransferase [Planctomycetia bacterium]|nr:GNAT family N-acetyltransferase [Planctomycetia bacterium]